MKWKNKGKEFEAYRNLLSKRKGFVLVGDKVSQAYFLNQVCHPFLRQVVEFEYDIKKLIAKHDNEHLIVVTEFGMNGEEMMNRLLRAGYIRGTELFHYSDTFWAEIRALNNPFVPAFALYVLGKIYISSCCFIPTTRCNLNCRDCLNFTPYINSFTTRDIGKAIADVDLLFKWVDYTDIFQISGGEPLLYQELAKLINYIGKKYRDKIASFELVTNGTIIPSDEICMAIRENNVLVYLDNYTSSIPSNLNNREGIISQFEKYNIDWVDNTVEEWFSLEPDTTDNSGMTEEELAEYYDKCNAPWHNFEDGKMYSCNFAKYAMRAGMIEDSPNDYFDFNAMNQNKKEELVEFLLGYTDKGYVDFCKRCAMWGPSNTKPVPVAVQIERGQGCSCGKKSSKG